MSLSYSCKCKDFKEKKVGEAKSRKGGKYSYGILYVPTDWIGRDVVILLEPEQ